MASDSAEAHFVFGLLAMLLLVAYVVSTRQFRRDMDVATFMATICPIAALAVLAGVILGHALLRRA